MIISKEAELKWNAKIKRHYVELGYAFTKMNESFIAKIEHLTKGSNAKIIVKCDYCGEKYDTKWEVYNRLRIKDYVNKDCCGNPKCTGKKAKETIQAKYGVNNIRELDFVNEKIKNTNIEKYGCENPFGNKEIQRKLKETNIEKYGEEIPSKSPIIKKKIAYGCKKFYIDNPEKRKIGEKSARWIGDADYKRGQRSTNEYNIWRKQVFAKNNYTCQRCGIKRTKSSQPKLNAHHIKNFSKYEDIRNSVDNGITLCECCHKKFHNIYGKTNNNELQLKEFINLDEKIC